MFLNRKVNRATPSPIVDRTAPIVDRTAPIVDRATSPPIASISKSCDYYKEYHNAVVKGDEAIKLFGKSEVTWKPNVESVVNTAINTIR